MTEFKNLNLDTRILSALNKKGYTTPTPIQLQAIPHVLEGKDLMGIAQTGTGKTAAFSLPILNNLAKTDHKVLKNHLRCLILTPTRELASQIAENVEAYGKDLDLSCAVIFGGVGEKPQIDKLARGIDIVIATPGRLLDLMNQGHVRYSQLEILVLDEADRMLDMGFINDVKKIVARLPVKRQALFFSATMSDAIARLAHTILKSPVRVEVTPQSTTVEKIAQKVLFVERSNKVALLKTILKQDDVKNVLVFSQTKHGANKILEHLQKSAFKVAAIHGNKSQSAREKALADFRSGAAQVLIATDIAARGIDVPGLSHVINYDVPQDPENYVHRIGRTARAGLEGVALTFCDNSERILLSSVEKLIRMKIPVDTSHPFHGVAPAAGEPRRLSKSFAPRSHSSSSAPRGGSLGASRSHGGGRSNEERRMAGRERSASGKSSGNRSENHRVSAEGGTKSESGKSSFGSRVKSLFGFGKKAGGNESGRSEGYRRPSSGRKSSGGNYKRRSPQGNR